MAEVLRESLPDALVYVPAVYSLLVRVLCETPLDATSLSLTLCPLSRQGTYDGVDVCGERVLPELRRLVAAHPTLTALSLVGYSFGGLVARYLAGCLFVDSFLGLSPLNLVTFASPHLGPILSSARAQPLLRTLGGLSGQQMALTDANALLLLMAHPRSAFMKGLAAFARRACYANASNDRTVPFWTSFISSWLDGAPLGPPKADGASPTSPFPHIEWQGSCADAAASVTGEAEMGAPSAEALSSSPAVDVAEVAAETEDALRSVDIVRLALLAPLGMLILPVWLTVMPAVVTSLGIYKRHTVHRVAIPQALLLLDGDPWERVRQSEAEAMRDPQPWMAAQLNALPWLKVSVRFSLAKNGLNALHTHGLLVVRRRNLHAAGMDVLQHLATSAMLRAAAPLSDADEDKRINE